MADTNWIATAAPIVHLGAKPVFVDILPESWCIDLDLAEAASRHAPKPLPLCTCTAAFARWTVFWQ